MTYRSFMVISSWLTTYAAAVAFVSVVASKQVRQHVTLSVMLPIFAVGTIHAAWRPAVWRDPVFFGSLEGFLALACTALSLETCHKAFGRMGDALGPQRPYAIDAHRHTVGQAALAAWAAFAFGGVALLMPWGEHYAFRGFVIGDIGAMAVLVAVRSELLKFGSTYPLMTPLEKASTQAFVYILGAQAVTLSLWEVSANWAKWAGFGSSAVYVYAMAEIALSAHRRPRT